MLRYCQVAVCASRKRWGRQRLQINTDVRREPWRDFYVSLSGYDSYDSEPPNPSSAHNDVGIVISISWTYGR